MKLENGIRLHIPNNFRAAVYSVYYKLNYRGMSRTIRKGKISRYQMNWTKVDKDWWRGGGGAWIRRVYFSGAERCGCEECGGKLFWLKGEYYCGWRDGDSVIGYFKTFKECAENLEKEKI